MKKCILFALFLVVLASLCMTAYADIPANAQYKAWYHKISGVPTWEYLPGSEYYGIPYWGYDDLYYWWHVPNLHVEDSWKAVYYEVEFQPGYQPTMPPNLYLNVPYGSVNHNTPIYNPTNNSWTWSWFAGMQPDWENVYWWNYNYFTPLSPEWYQYRDYYYWFHDLNHVTKIEVATVCTTIPEPSSLMALAGMMGAAGGLLLRKRK